MDGLFGFIGEIPASAWGFAAFAVSLSAIVQTWSHAWREFHQWRLDRRLARDSYISREEMNQYRLDIGEDLPPLDLGRVAARALTEGLFVAVPAWLATHKLEEWWLAGVLAFGGLALLLAWWRWLNDPNSDPAVLKFPKGEVPREAVTGFAAAIGCVAVLLAGIYWLF
jgi:hypothetical protein